MSAGGQVVARWWNAAPDHRVTFLADADPRLLAIALDPLPEGAAAIVQFRPPATGTVSEQVEQFLAELDVLVRALFPRWLVGAADFGRSGLLAIPAARAVALRVASESASFGPFLADLAERSLGGRGSHLAFPADVRAAGLARAIADAYGRDSAAVLVTVPHGLSREGETALAGAAEWLCARGRFTVWLAGEPLRNVDRIRTVSVALPSALARLAGVPGEADEACGVPIVQVPALHGVPRADSAAEQALEQALAPHDWAAGRQWNGTHEAAELARAYRLDLCWRSERVVVEVDGPEHRLRVMWADDRARDVYLQMHGYDVLRFPNETVLEDVLLVIHQIHEVLRRRRAGVEIPEMRHHVD